MEHNSYSDHEIKHIEMVESIIQRMGQNSFSLKEWTMTLIVAICAFSAAGSERRFALVASAPIIVFWFLDSFYLQKERQYRELYNRIIRHDVSTFSMDISSIKEENTKYIKCLFSITEWLFYGVCIVAIIIVFVWLNKETGVVAVQVGG